jgi:hypothetical protein
MAPHINPLRAQVSIAADMIKVLLGVDCSQRVSRTRRACVTMNGLRGQCVTARVHDQGHRIADNKSRIHAPGR